MRELLAAPTFWSWPTFRDGSAQLTAWKTFPGYLAVMISLTLPFLVPAVSEATGLTFFQMAVFVSLHALDTALFMLVGPNRIHPFGNALFAVALPFMTRPYQPLAWMFYFIHAANDAMLYKPAAMLTAHIFVVPIGAWAIDSWLMESPRASLGAVLFVASTSAVIYLWLSRITFENDRLAQSLKHLSAERAREQERERISADLHDELGAALTGLVLRSQVAAKIIERDPSGAKTMLRQIEQTARQCVQQLRLLMRSLEQKEVILRDFEAALRRLATEIAPGVAQVQCNGGTELRLEAEVAHHLLLMAGEGVTNALRHGMAQNVLVRMSWTVPWELVIEDDGRAGTQDPSRIHLRTIQKRALQIGACVSVERHEPTGLRVRITGPTQALSTGQPSLDQTETPIHAEQLTKTP